MVHQKEIEDLAASLSSSDDEESSSDDDDSTDQGGSDSIDRTKGTSEMPPSGKGATGTGKASSAKGGFGKGSPVSQSPSDRKASVATRKALSAERPKRTKTAASTALQPATGAPKDASAAGRQSAVTEGRASESTDIAPVAEGASGGAGAGITRLAAHLPQTDQAAVAASSQQPLTGATAASGVTGSPSAVTPAAQANLGALFSGVAQWPGPPPTRSDTPLLPQSHAPHPTSVSAAAFTAGAGFEAAPASSAAQHAGDGNDESVQPHPQVGPLRCENVDLEDGEMMLEITSRAADCLPIKPRPRRGDERTARLLLPDKDVTGRKLSWIPRDITLRFYNSSGILSGSCHLLPTAQNWKEQTSLARVFAQRVTSVAVKSCSVCLQNGILFNVYTSVRERHANTT